MSFLKYRVFLLILTLTLLPGQSFAQQIRLKTLDTTATEGVVSRNKDKNRIPLEVDVVRFFSVNENMWQILADDYSNETSVAKGLLVKVEFNSTVNANSFKDSMILVDALTEDCDLIFESSINEDIPNETIKCTMLFSGIE